MKTYEETIRQLAVEHTLRNRQMKQFEYTVEAHKEAISADLNLVNFIYGRTYNEIERDIKTEQEKSMAGKTIVAIHDFSPEI